MRRRLDAHVTRKLCPPAQERARDLRRAMYASWSDGDLHREYASLYTVAAAATWWRREFVETLARDVRTEITRRAVSPKGP